MDIQQIMRIMDASARRKLMRSVENFSNNAYWGVHTKGAENSDVDILNCCWSAAELRSHPLLNWHPFFGQMGKSRKS